MSMCCSMYVCQCVAVQEEGHCALSASCSVFVSVLQCVYVSVLRCVCLSVCCSSRGRTLCWSVRFDEEANIYVRVAMFICLCNAVLERPLR